jgi:uncharacterized membrane protein YciS (DUF1049 family)
MLQFGAVPITPSVILIIELIVWLFIIGLLVHFLTSAIRFMKIKNRTDQEIVSKIDRLIEQLNQKNDSRDS